MQKGFNSFSHTDNLTVAGIDAASLFLSDIFFIFFSLSLYKKNIEQQTENQIQNNCSIWIILYSTFMKVPQDLTSICLHRVRSSVLSLFLFFSSSSSDLLPLHLSLSTTPFVDVDAKRDEHNDNDKSV